jgi:hypothetical protein
MARAERIESIVDRLAAALFAAAVAFVEFKFGPSKGPRSWAFAAGAWMAGYVLCTQALGRIRREEPRFELADFEPQQIEAAPELGELLLTDQVELILTEADRVEPEPADTDELLLVDILNEIGPESRVVRLFDPASMPTPGELNARVRRHLDGESPSAAPADASQALYDALTELKRSLR